ncbi:GntR family transcriptional regulator [Breznakia blatticola]|uniref:GntR family transcriptional regulator n=1 Tax=Breznakia blatticola TaxID=1754012 RepID=A0A4R7ZME2_9FIRM|nr:GntR family transcriptional regulator [Breznakia blatticola]TDW16380.1 GntR family transcriptional regulator [Breznakia blatticola]
MDYRMPIYIQIKDAIIKKINNQEYLPGEAIPSERKLAEMYQVNRMTVKKAIESLVEEGYLFRIHGKGTFVQRKNSQRLILGGEDAYGISALLREQGAQTRDIVLEKGMLKAFNYLGSKMELAKYEDVYLIHRLRCANDAPFAMEYCYMPFKYFEDVDDYNFEDVSIYDYMARKGRFPQKFKQRLIIIEADEKLAKQMGIKINDPLYYFEYIGQDSEGHIVEYTESYLRCDKAVFTYEAIR